MDKLVFTSPDAITAITKIVEAVSVNDGDTLARLLRDDHRVWTASGSWSPSVHVTLGDMRAIAREVKSHD